MSPPTFCKYVSFTDRTAIWPDNIQFSLPIVDGAARFQFETRGPWSILTKIEGLAVEETDTGVEVHGVRSLKSPRESGYQHEGRVSIRGQSLRAFTSSRLFLVAGKLVDVGILYICKAK